MYISKDERLKLLPGGRKAFSLIPGQIFHTLFATEPRQPLAQNVSGRFRYWALTWRKFFPLRVVLYEKKVVYLKHIFHTELSVKWG